MPGQPKEARYIYRIGKQKPKSVALRRPDDWITGLSFTSLKPAQTYLTYNVQKLRNAGYVVRFDQPGALVLDVHTGLKPASGLLGLNRATFGLNHVSVYLVDLVRWDRWFEAEKKLEGDLPYYPSVETQNLYDLREKL